MDQLWSMYNRDEKLRIDDLKTEHVRIILLAIPTRRMEGWFACREGAMSWVPISEVPEFYEDVRALKGAAEAEDRDRIIEDVDKEAKTSTVTRVKKAKEADMGKPAVPPVHKANAPERRPMFEEMPLEKTHADLNVVTTVTSERRSARRYARVFSFEVKRDGKAFRCETLDISLNGISLNRAMPSWVPKNFRASLVNQGARVRIACARVSDTKLRLLDAEAWDLIRLWIMNGQ